jgi:hypothetical protein
VIISDQTGVNKMILLIFIIIAICLLGRGKRHALKQERQLQQLIMASNPYAEGAQPGRIDDLRRYGPFAAMARKNRFDRAQKGRE